MFLSIIVPAYNMEKYIDRCIKSILDQNFDDYEIIVIDDCSIDLTVEKMKKWNNKRITIVTNERNSGLSYSRNRGLKIAKGEFVMFVDSDDYIEADSLEAIRDGVINLNKPDVTYLGYYLEKNGTIEMCHDFISEFGRCYGANDFLIRELTNRCIPVPACFAIYRKQFLLDNHLFFKEGIFHEDELWAPIMLMNAKTVGTLDVFFYHYNIRYDSITQKKDRTKNGLDLIDSCNELIDYIEKKVCNERLASLMNNHIAMIYLKAMCRGKLYRHPYNKKIKRLLPYRLSCFWKDKAKSLLFACSLRLYYLCDRQMGHNI